MPMPECAVCFEPTENQLFPCHHSICKSCIVRWCAKNQTCPLCKAFVLSPVIHQELLKNGRNTLCVPVSDKPDMGVRLCNASGTVGLRVLRVDKAGIMRACGLHRGDVITHINDIRVIHHEVGVRMIDECTVLKFPMQLTILVNERKHKSFCNALHRCMGKRSPLTSPQEDSEEVEFSSV